MEKLKDLKDLLKHEVMDLYSAEEQIIAALPKMITKANDPALKMALEQHLAVTEKQKARLDEVQALLREEGEQPPAEKKGFLSGLFGGGGQKCKGTQGLIEEGEKLMSENMNPEVMDAAIIGCAQKIEHYEICGYGTAKAFARELGLADVARLLNETLDEEYEADNRLTAMAVGRLNEKAEVAADAAGKPRSNRGKAPSSVDGSTVKTNTGTTSPASAPGTKGGKPTAANRTAKVGVAVKNTSKQGNKSIDGTLKTARTKK